MKRGDPGVRDRHRHERDAELVWPRPARRHPPTPAPSRRLNPRCATRSACTGRARATSPCDPALATRRDGETVRGERGECEHVSSRSTTGVCAPRGPSPVDCTT